MYSNVFCSSSNGNWPTSLLGENVKAVTVNQDYVILVCNTWEVLRIANKARYCMGYWHLRNVIRLYQNTTNAQNNDVFYQVLACISLHLGLDSSSS